jgi:pilus assembly protein CpaC
VIKSAYNRLAPIAAVVTFLLLISIALWPSRSSADQIITLTLTAGEAYEIKNVDSEVPPAVSFTNNSNSFTVKSSGPNSLTVFSFQPGEGSVDARVGGQNVTYHVIVNGVVNASKPLAPSSGPPPSAGAAHTWTAAPVPYAPASAAVANASAAGTPPPATLPPGPGPATGSAASAIEAGGYGTSAAATAEATSHGALSPTKGTTAGGSAPDSGTGPVAMEASGPDSGYAGGSGSTKTEVVGPVAFGGAAGNAEEVGTAGAYAPAPAGSASTHGPLSPNVTISESQAWHEEPQSEINQQFTTDPRSYRPEGYALSRAFGGRHNLPPETINITSGTSQVYDFGGPISRVSISNTRVADVQVLGNHQLMLVGHEPGFSSLVVWDSQGNYIERQIWTEIAGNQQVMLHAIVAEVDLSKLEQQGINLSIALTKYGFTFTSLPGLVASPYTASGGTGPAFQLPGGTPLPLLFSQNMTYAVAGQNSNVSTFAMFQFLETHDLAKILARPQLLANSGQKAKFLSGGEIPIVITQALTSTIVFKEYGTSVSFVPTVIGSRDIDLLVRPEVSQPDYTQGVELFGFNVPAFVTRKAETRVRLHDNQTLIIAGLIQDANHSTVQKVPYLGDVPYVGALFRNTYWQHVKTELVMSVTPEIVRPLPAGGEISLPTERQGPLTPEQIRTQSLTTPDAARPRF